MKTKNRIQQSKYLLAGFVMTLAAVLGAATYTETVNGITWTYTISNGEASVGGGYSSSTVVPSPTSGAIVIPSTLGGRPVTSIGSYAFSGCSWLTSVTIPGSVTSIGDDAFSSCRLTSVTIPDSVTSIGRSAFNNCRSLTSVAIPDSVTNIGDCAFSGCSGLTRVTIPCSVTNIEPYAFYNCSGLTRVTIPDSVTNIDPYAFSGCNGLVAFDISSGNTFYKSESGILLTKDGKTLVLVPSGLTIVAIPCGVTNIGAYAFYNCRSLTSVTIPDSVTSIDDESFRNCSALTNVWIGSGVMYIGTNAFRDCYALLNVEIGGGVEVIGNSAFRGCSRLSDITIPAGVNTIENYAFAECNSLEDVVIPDSVGFIGPSAFSSCGGLTNVTIGTGVTRIGSYAFRYCSRLVTVVFEGKCPSNMGSSVFGGVSSECCAYIHRASRGWGTVIPRSWNGITLDYIQHDVFFVANGGTCNVSSVSVADGLPIGILPTPVLTNAVFLGWFTSADGGSQMDEAMIVTQSTTLYAHWLPQTLDEAMDVDVSVRLATSEVNPWMPVFDSTAKVGDTTARSGAIGDKTNTWITATVSGAGTMSFWLKTSCEYDDEENALAADRLMIYTNGVEIVEWRMDGETDWTRREVSFAGGENTVKWVYYKDKSGVGGEDCAWVDGVMWTLTDPIPPIVSDSEVLTALAGTTDVNLTANVTNAAQYTAYRAWALSVTNDTTTAQMVKESTRTWLSYAFAADALIDKELTSDDVKIESFTTASTDGKFEFTVSVKDVNIGGGSVAVETLKENLKKVLGIEGSATLSPGGFSSDNIDITFDTPVDGKARFIVSPPADAGNSFFMRVKVK